MKILTSKINFDFLLKAVIFALILIFYGSVLLNKIDLPTDDLGRHLTNGKIIWETKSITETNFYSYTNPDFPFLNHHWLSGVVFYFMFVLVGFNGLILFKIILLLAAFSLVFFVAAKKGDFWIASLISIPAIFILSERSDARPEIFSYFFTALFLYFLFHFSDNPKSKKIYWLIPLQIVWVNLHIYFFIGPAMVAGFLLEKIILNRKNLKNNPIVKNLSFLFFSLIIACFLNPAGYKTAFYPLNIFKNYGYDIVENKSPFFLEHLMHNPAIPFFKIGLGILISSFIISIIFRNFSVFFFLASFSTAIASIIAIRNFPFFALILIPTASSSLKNFSQNLFNQIKDKVHFFQILFALLLMLLLFASAGYEVKKGLPSNKEKGIGLTFESNSAAEFFKQKNLKGPIFNNYDIGSYLIYHLYPIEKVFVDNRPEAYPKLFFDGIYLPMQMEEEKWQEIKNQYNFNVIFFTQQEGTWWGRKFLSARLKDSEWILIYADSQSAILLKNIPLNQEIIGKYRIDKNNISQKISYLIDSENINIKFSAINLLELIERDDIAFSICQKIVEKNPKERRAWMEMGNIKSNEGDIGAQIEAANYLEKAISLDENLPGIYNQLGLVYFNLGQFTNAKSAWEKALNKDPKNKSALNYLQQYKALNLP